MKKYDSFINRMVLQDAVILGVFLVSFIGLTRFVMTQVLSFVTESPLYIILCVIGALCMLILGSAMLWIFLQLLHNRADVYGQELDMKQKIQEEKENDFHET